MVEAHSSKYFVHSGTIKIYKDLKQHYWCKSMKVDIFNFVIKCLNCQQVKVEQQSLVILLGILKFHNESGRLPNINFVAGLPCTKI